MCAPRYEPTFAFAATPRFTRCDAIFADAHAAPPPRRVFVPRCRFFSF